MIPEPDLVGRIAHQPQVIVCARAFHHITGRGLGRARCFGQPVAGWLRLDPRGNELVTDPARRTNATRHEVRIGEGRDVRTVRRYTQPVSRGQDALRGLAVPRLLHAEPSVEHTADVRVAHTREPGDIGSGRFLLGSARAQGEVALRQTARLWRNGLVGGQHFGVRAGQFVVGDAHLPRKLVAQRVDPDRVQRDCHQRFGSGTQEGLTRGDKVFQLRRVRQARDPVQLGQHLACGHRLGWGQVLQPQQCPQFLVEGPTPVVETLLVQRISLRIGRIPETGIFAFAPLQLGARALASGRFLIRVQFELGPDPSSQRLTVDAGHGGGHGLCLFRDEGEGQAYSSARHRTGWQPEVLGQRGPDRVRGRFGGLGRLCRAEFVDVGGEGRDLVGVGCRLVSVVAGIRRRCPPQRVRDARLQLRIRGVRGIVDGDTAVQRPGDQPGGVVDTEFGA
ncbi:hypothetical protein [Nocardia niwae]|uniref:hypothetical protein n=1 Tax=Nocardia niwae TaxID=626084 RepID=UPI0033C5A686